jgi:S-DNA-T family DNA segregation ATPase FtsK/SpoIIIE
MSQNKKSKSKNAQLSFKMGATDERLPKLGGLLCLFFALYLFVAFTSYIFTWQEDQNHVINFSWELLLQRDIAMANWLGRLGAVVSHQFFYWWFGLPSYIIVFLLAVTGFALIKRTPFNKVWGVYRLSFWLLLFSSIFLEFCFGDSDFPWGGAFGDAVNSWLYNFVGIAGQFLLFLLIIGAVLVWTTNPNFNEFSFKKIRYDVSTWYEDLMSGALWQKLRANRRAPATAPERAAPDAADALRKATEAAINEDKKQASQLAFDLVDPERSPTPHESLRAGESELEIAASPEMPLETDAEGDILEIAEENMDTDLDPELAIAQGNQNHSEPYDPTLELSAYQPPILELLEEYENKDYEIDRAELETNKDQIIETLLNYKIEIIKIKATIGPTVTLYEIVPAPGVRISRIKNLEDDIALSLAALGIRIIAPIPGRGTIGIEVPNKNKQIVSLKEVLHSDKYRKAKMDLPIVLGKTISNEVFVADLAKMPHLLIAGATGQGKSVGINTILMSILYKKHPSQVKLVLVDPKKVELFPYSKLENHFLGYLPNAEEPITTETTKVVHTLNSLCIEMDNRYNLLKKAHVRNIKEYNEKFTQRRLNPEKGHQFLPFIVLVIDEFADLIMTAGKEIELPIGRLAQLARAVGIHLIIATQRPSVNIITGIIKANFPARLAFKVTSKIDSRTILDHGGAEQLIGMGDMLLSIGADAIRLQCAFIDTPEVERVLDFIGSQRGYPAPYFLPEFVGDDEEHDRAAFKLSEMDDMLEDAARLIVQNQQGSTSMLQRKLKLGYNRAGRIMDQLEALGLVGPSDGSKAREVLMFDEMEVVKFFEKLKRG